MSENNSTRLNKYISESGLCSRREADRYIEQGLVSINGVRAKIGRQVFARDRVVVNGEPIEPKTADESIFIAFNKPIGITCTTEAGTRNNIVDYIKYGQRIFPIGRLDKDSQGLIFLTSNGDIVNKILRAGNNHEKEYLVTVNKPITDPFIETMSTGVAILGVNSKKCFVKKETPLVFRIVLIQGLNRQIRRMCEQLGYEVTKLERIRIMNISLKNLPVGDWRELSKKEMDIINDMIKNSSATEEASKKSNPKTEAKSETQSTQKKKSAPKRNNTKKKIVSSSPKTKKNIKKYSSHSSNHRSGKSSNRRTGGR
jgi:23S rRNA pseudouridine2604 synthase